MCLFATLGRRIARISSLAVLVAVVSAMLLGCVRSEVTDKPPRYVKSSGEEQISQLGQGGTARVALPESTKPECLDPFFAACHGAESLGAIVFEGLLMLGPDAEFRPGLAADVPSYDAGTLSLEPTSVDLRLRENAAFSDGEPVTTEDVLFTYGWATRLADSGLVSPVYSGFGRVEDIEVVEGAGGAEGDIVRITFDGAYSGWRDVLAAPVLPEHVYGGSAADEPLPLGDEPVGSGPFLLADSGENGLSFTANPRYWMNALELPRLDGLELDYQSPGEAADSLFTGRADVGLFPTARSVPDSGDVLRADAHRTRTEMLVFNSDRMDDEVRAAASSALDRARIAEEVSFNPARGAFTSPFAGGAVPDAQTWVSRPEGFVEPGTTLNLVYPSGGVVRDRVAESVAAQLESAGFVVQLRRESPSEFYGATLPAGDFDVSLQDFGSLPEYEAVSELLPPESSLAVTGIAETNEDRSLYVAATEEVLVRDSAVVPLFVWPDTFAWSSTLSGPKGNVPGDSFAWNVREWAFYK